MTSLIHQLWHVITKVKVHTLRWVYGPCSCSKARHVCLTRGHVFLLSKKRSVSSCSTRRHVCLFSKKQKTCLLVEQEDMSSCWTRQHVFYQLLGVWETELWQGLEDFTWQSVDSHNETQKKVNIHISSCTLSWNRRLNLPLQQKNVCPGRLWTHINKYIYIYIYIYIR